MPDTSDPMFSNPRLAATYDVFDSDRSDLDHYEAIVREFGASSVLDVGCGTGVFACRLAAVGTRVIGVDPARASIDLARRKPGADRVDWHVGTAKELPSLSVDMAVMTANVAQVFVTDDDWHETLTAIAAAVRPGGHLVFETRDPARKAWEGWTPAATRAIADLPDGDRAETWCTVTAVDPTLVTFRWRTRFESDRAELVSDSTLRFRTQAELAESLDLSGFDVVDVRDAPDRPGLEWVYIAQRREPPP